MQLLGQVRVWSIARNCCVNVMRFDFSIISLAFHPEGHFVAVASGPQVITTPI